ncbi:hypothetical protein EST38_g2714 [Candolleomyces aberdarensis]|uniref:Uncharacterized protein n=1 Tax=Candolleomyces aberdarensis TaxID=2316362 RepID=A0A4Q2DUZ2_9AGAR|nr:hypothetical protein EST38_g2714 [Candolleomyces aberdarensis]
MASSVPDSIVNVTISSLLNLAGVAPGDYDDKDDATKARFLSIQLGMLQSQPRQMRAPLDHELAAKHLPELTEKYANDPEVIGRTATLINTISYTPYFARFVKTDAGKDFVPVQTKRIAQLTDEDASKLSRDQVAEIGQFYSTLLLLQGQDGISEDDKKATVSRLTKWQRAYSGTFAEETLERCLAALGGNKGYVLDVYTLPRHRTIALTLPLLGSP